LTGEADGFIQWIWVPESLRRNVYGSKLIEISESVLKSVGCKVVSGTPSGKGRDIFYKIGYSETESGLMYKTLA